MKWFDKWLYGKVRDMWDNKHRYEAEKDYQESKAVRGLNMATVSVGQLAKANPEGENRITFELSSAVGGKILNVRHYDHRTDRHEAQTYVIPNGEDVGERVAKIINLEMFKQ